MRSHIFVIVLLLLAGPAVGVATSDMPNTSTEEIVHQAMTDLWESQYTHERQVILKNTTTGEKENSGVEFTEHVDNDGEKYYGIYKPSGTAVVTEIYGDDVAGLMSTSETDEWRLDLTLRYQQKHVNPLGNLDVLLKTNMSTKESGEETLIVQIDDPHSVEELVMDDHFYSPLDGNETITIHIDKDMAAVTKIEIVGKEEDVKRTIVSDIDHNSESDVNRPDDASFTLTEIYHRIMDIITNIF